MQDSYIYYVHEDDDAVECIVRCKGKYKNEIQQALKLKEIIEARIKIDEFTMDEYVRNATAKSVSKETKERYWNAVHSCTILTNMLEESKNV